MFRTFSGTASKSHGVYVMGLTNAALAKEIGVTAGRVSQWKSEGKLEGCFSGVGRNLRYDLERVRAALGRTLDAGQMLGNGAATRKALRSAPADLPEAAPVEAAPAVPITPTAELPSNATALAASLLPPPSTDYELARTRKAVEEARRLERQNQVEEGAYLLASEVDLLVARALGREVAQFETVLRNGARAIADRLGVDYREARAILLELWRAHRTERASELTAEAEAASAAGLSEAEAAADI